MNEPSRSAPDLGRPARDGLGETVLRSGAVTLGAQAARLVLGVVGSIALARMLTPRDFGLVAMVAAVLGLLATVQQCGLSLATVQRQDLRAEQVSALFWVSLGLGLLLMGVTAVLAPWLARFYDEPRLAPIALSLSLGFFVAGVSVQHRALLQREMRFATLAGSDLAALTLATIGAIAAARAGFGIWALVLLPLLREVAGTVLVWRACPWRPDRPRRGVAIRPLLVFGGHVTAANLLQALARNLDKVLIGWFWGAASLGFYSKACELALAPIRQLNAPLSSVAIPVLSRLQAEPERYRALYLRALGVIAWVGLPVLAVAVVLSHEIVVVLLGEAWAPASPLFAVLACAAFVQLIANTAGWIFVSLGRTKRMLAWASIASTAVALSAAAGLPWGPLGVAVAYAVCVYLLRVPHFAMALRDAPVTVDDVVRCVTRPAALAVAAGAAMASAHAALAGFDLAVVVAGTLAAGALTGLALAALWDGLRHEIADLLELTRRLAASGRPKAQRS